MPRPCIDEGSRIGNCRDSPRIFLAGNNDSLRLERSIGRG